MDTLKKINRHLKYFFRSRIIKVHKRDNALKWAVLGLGNMANVFSKALTLSPYARINAVASRSSEKSKRFAGKYNVPKSYGCYTSMLEEENNDYDIVYIATPVQFHYENIKEALENGKNVLCEKPITSNACQLRELIDLAASKSLFLMEGLWSLYLPTHRIAKQWIDQGKIGDIKSIRVDLSKREIINAKDIRFQNNECAGVLMDYGVYALAFALNYLGGKIEIESVENILSNTGFDQEWHIVLSDGRCKAFITISSIYGGDKKAVIVGEKGSIEWAPQFNRSNSIMLYAEDGTLIEQSVHNYISDGFEYEIEHVYREFHGKKVSNVSQSLKVLDLIDALKAMVKQESKICEKEYQS